MKRMVFILLSLFICFSAMAQPVYVDLNPLFDRDVVVESAGSALTDPLDEDGSYVDAGTLPASYSDGVAVDTQDGRTTFQFAPLHQNALDAVEVNGQSIDVPDGNYGSIDLSLLSAPGGFGFPLSNIEFRYSDGSVTESRLGPVPGWMASPAAFDHTFFSYTDSSGVETITSFATDFGEDDMFNLLQESGNGNAGGVRFVDGTGFALYVLDVPLDLTQAKLGITVGNNFVISIATEYFDPEFSTTEGFEVIANSMELYDGFEHRALGNLKLYEFDLSPYLAAQTGEIYILFTDATPSNGWGPYIQNISLFTGENKTFEEDLSPTVDDSNATVYAAFRTNGGTDEKPYLYDNSGSGPSNRQHRFADGSGSITYSFDLPDDVDDAKLTVDMANNFVVSLSGPMDTIRYASVSPGSEEERDYLVDDGNSISGNNYRFADASSYMIYQFDLDDSITSAIAQINVGNQFVIEVASGLDGEFQVERDWVAETGNEIRDNTNLDTYNIPIDSYLNNNPQNIIRIRLSDGQPADGWGPYLTGISIVNQVESGTVYEEVLNSMDMFGEDIHNEYNKDYYTIDLTSVLANNTSKQFSVQFTDGSTADGWGPGLFWMAVYSGELNILSDKRVFNDLKTTLGEPVNTGLGLNHRRYALDPSKTLTEIMLPEQPDAESDTVYLLAATLNPGGTNVADWMVH